MATTELKNDFRTLALKDGSLIERVIARYYASTAEQWPAPGVMFDGGAHVGYHSLRMAALDKVDHVIAVEANRATFERFERILEKDEHGSKIRLHFVAIQNDPECKHVSFLASPSHPGRSGINPILRNAENTTFEEQVNVPATTIDKLVAGEQQRIGFIKLDFEGGEYHALLGAADTLKNGRPFVFFENSVHSPKLNGYTIEEFGAYMSSLGYELCTVFGEPMTGANAADFWYATATPNELLPEHRDKLQKSIQAELGTISR